MPISTAVAVAIILVIALVSAYQISQQIGEQGFPSLGPQEGGIVGRTCSDSDGGYNIYAAGQCISTRNLGSDKCNSDGTLTEYSCSSSIGNPRCLSSAVTCPIGYGCSNGACAQLSGGNISTTTTTTAISTTTTTMTTQTTATTSTTTTTTTITYPPGVYNITVNARGSYAGGGWPQMVVVLDKTQNISTWIVASSDYKPYSVLANIPDGTHEIGVAFTNDYYNSATGEDRNLYVQSIVINGFPQYPTGSNVIYDRSGGSFATYFDGIDVLPGTTGMAWRGALRFTIQFPFPQFIMSADFTKYQGTSKLSYGAHPTDLDIASFGLTQTPFDKIRPFNYSYMRFQYGRVSPCSFWNSTTHSCDSRITNFENWTIYQGQDNGYITTWLETANVHSGSHALHYYMSSPNPTNISLQYRSNLFPIDETKYYEAGFWSFPIQNSRYYDVSFYFYDANMKFLARRWGQNSLGSFSADSWNRRSTLWYPSSLGQGDGYLEKGAKYAQLIVYEVWHVSGTFEAIDDDAFVRQFSSLPSTTTRQSAVTNNLVSNPSFEGTTSLGYDWTYLDKMIGAIKSVGSQPVISLSLGNWGNANSLPAGMPLNYSLEQEGPAAAGYGDFPAMTDYCQYVKAIVQHTNVEKGFNVKYWEIGNEPDVCDPTIEKGYIDYFNLAESCMHQVDPSILLTSDESLHTEFSQNYLIPYAKNVGFLSFHNYDAGGNPMFPSNSSNMQNIYYPPNDQNSWLTDATIMQNVNKLSDSCTYCWCSYSPKEAHDLWLSRTGKDLEIIATEVNLNSVWRNGTDNRQNDIFGATWYAAKIKAYIMDGSDMNINYFVLSSYTTDKAMAPYGGFGFGMMNSSYPYSPYAPYWTNYFLTKYFPKGSLIYNSTSTYPGMIDALAVKSGSSYNILLINKIDKSFNLNLNVNGITVHSATLLYLDRSTYYQNYDPNIGKTIIYKSGIGSATLPAASSLTIPMNGYAVAVLAIT